MGRQRMRTEFFQESFVSKGDRFLSVSENWEMARIRYSLRAFSPLASCLALVHRVRLQLFVSRQCYPQDWCDFGH